MNLTFLSGLIALCFGLMGVILFALRQALLALDRLRQARFADLSGQRGRACPFREEPPHA